jgi:uncharacterized membrane protein YfcA
VRLVLIGLVAGFFSALFGVGGGIVVVPLLVAFLAYQVRPATATSLAAIVLIALVGTIAYGARGEVEPVQAALVGLPAAGGALIGATVQQRIASRSLVLAFAALLLVVAVTLLV